MTKTELTNKIEKLAKDHGIFYEYTMTQDAYHGCTPDMEYGWKAQAIKINESTAEVVYLWWDFKEFVNARGCDVEDAGDYPWDDDDLIEVTSVQTIDLTNSSDMRYLSTII